MHDGSNRAFILTTARELFEKDPDAFTLASVCRLTGFSRAALRRHFPNKNALIAGLNIPAILTPVAKLEHKASVSELPQGSETAPEAGTATVDTACDLPPPVVLPMGLAPEISEEDVPPMVAAPLPIVGDRRTASQSSRPTFQTREVAQKLLANVEQQPPPPRPQNKWPLTIQHGPRMAAVAAILFLTLTGGIGFVALGGLGRATQSPSLPEHRPVGATHVLVIDATGAAPDPMYQQASPALRDIVVRARRGETQAQVRLAQSFLKGDGFAADPVAAARWSDEAAARGDTTAQFILGTLYAEGIKPNPRLAFDWFSAAASRGNVKAMHDLAIAYLNGAGVAKDPKAAVDWFEKAAGAGYRDSAFDLAVLYERGEAVPQNSQEALKWYDHAASLGDGEAKQRAADLRAQLWQVVKR